MQIDDAELDFTPAPLESSPLRTPQVILSASPIKSQITLATNNASNLHNISSSSISTSTVSTENNTVLMVSSVDDTVSKIQDTLKQGLNDTRKPTPSPFQKMYSNISNSDKHAITDYNDGTVTFKGPTTADIVLAIEEITDRNPLQYSTKPFMNDNQEYEKVSNVGTNVPPKKKILIRGLSDIEQASTMHHNNLPQSQRVNQDSNVLLTQNGFDEENSIDDPMNSQLTRLTDLALMTQPIDINVDNDLPFKPVIDIGQEQNQNISIKAEQTMIPHTIIKQQYSTVNQTLGNNLNRQFPQSNINNGILTMTKTDPPMMAQILSNEVTSTGQISNMKRSRPMPMPTNNSIVTFRNSFLTSSVNAPLATSMPASTTTITNGTAQSTDQRRLQIRESNREAARRCRERRRQYIEQLEGDLQQHKAQMKQLNDRIARVERENTQLRAMLSETNIIHSGSRLTINDTHIDYNNAVLNTGLNINSDSNHHIDGLTVQRNYVDRNTH